MLADELNSKAQKTKIIISDEIISNIYKDQKLTSFLFEKFEWFDFVICQKSKLIRKPKLIEKIISNPQILKDLEQKFHPIILNKFKNIIEEKEKYDFMIFEVPLVFEANMIHLFDFIMLIKAYKNQRFLRKEKSIDERLHKIFLDSHFSEKEKAKFANFEILNNSNSIENLKNQIESLIKKII
jgi:dephospho-CoA kinase